MRVTFTLPGGHLGADGTCLRDGWLRPLSGRDEDWIHALPPATSRAAFVSGLLARCVRLGGGRVTRAMADNLTTGDRDFLVLKLYQGTFGSRLSLVLTCPHDDCAAKMDLDLAVDDLPVEERALEASYRLHLDQPEPIDVEFRLPRGSDELHLAARAESSDRRRDLLDDCILSGRVPAWAADEVAAAIDELAPRVESEIEAHCPECERPFDFDLDVVSLLLQQVGRGRAGLDREIHLLAFHYHWPLRELLSLTRPRRERFLRLLMGELARG